MESTDYDWETPAPVASYDGGTGGARGRSIGSWVVLALLASLFLHAMLYVVFRGYKIGDYTVFEGILEKEDLIPIKVNDVTVHDPSERGPSDISTDVQDLPDTDIDIIELAKALPPEEMRLSPEFSMPTNIDLSENPLAGVLEPMMVAPESSLVDDIASEIEASKSVLETPKVSDNQPLISIDEDALLADTSLQDFMDKVSTSGNGDDSVTNGYANLDDLLTYKGPVLEGKPILMPTDLLFAYNAASLHGNARLSLMKLGFIIQKSPDSVFVIEGHTDSFGADAYNMTLSQKRAMAVKSWLSESLGISGARIRTQGYGKTRPIVSNEGTIEEQALNRRVEIAILSKKEAEAKLGPEIRRAQVIE